MALISLRQLLDHAAEFGYGVPAFNINNMEQVQAIMQAAAETDSPVILQVSAGARRYAGEAFLRHIVQAAVESWPHIPIVLHQDHGASAAVCQGAIRGGSRAAEPGRSRFAARGGRRLAHRRAVSGIRAAHDPSRRDSGAAGEFRLTTHPGRTAWH